MRRKIIMQMVIEISEEMYSNVMNGTYCGTLYEELKRGIVLPRNHGQLVDYDEMKKRAGDFGMYAEAIVSHFKPQVIVEAESVEKMEIDHE
jgi:hypothetical protein